MKRSLRFQWYLLRCQPWLMAALLAAAVLQGLVSGNELRAYNALRVQPLEGMSALILVIDGRRLLGMIGALWVCAFAGSDFDSGGIQMAVCRGISRSAVFGAKLLVLLLGCTVFALLELLTALAYALPGWYALPLGYLLRVFLLRIALDWGLLLTPLAVVYLARNTVRALPFGGLYGLAVWLRLGTHYAMWQLDLSQVSVLSDFWPIPAGILSILLSYGLWMKAELRT